MAPPDTIWHKESLKLKEIFGTREGFEICPNKFSQRPIISPPLYVSGVGGGGDEAHCCGPEGHARSTGPPPQGMH